MLARTCAALGSVAVLGIGAAAWTWPRQSTRTYGIPTDDEDTLAYVPQLAIHGAGVLGVFAAWALVRAGA